MRLLSVLTRVVGAKPPPTLKPFYLWRLNLCRLFQSQHKQHLIKLTRGGGGGDVCVGGVVAGRDSDRGARVIKSQ